MSHVGEAVTPALLITGQINPLDGRIAVSNDTNGHTDWMTRTVALTSDDAGVFKYYLKVVHTDT